MPAIRIFRRLRDLLDVTFGTPADGDVLSYDTGTDKFVLSASAAGGGAPSGPAGGVLGGTYPDPSFAVDMATQAEQDAAIAALSSVYQPLDSDLTAIAALTTTSFGRALLALANAAALRTAAGLGTAATSNTGDFDAAGAAAAAQAASQPLDSDLTSIAALSTTSYGRGLLTLANQAALDAAVGIPVVSASAPSSPTDGELWWDTDDATPASGSSQTFSGAYAYRTSNQTIANGSLGTAIVFDSSLYDTDNYLISDTDPDHPGEFLIPSDGLYRICAFLLFDDTTDDSPAVGVEIDEDGLALGPQSANYLPVWVPANPHSLGYTDVTVMYGPMPLLAGSHVQIRGLTNDSVDGQVLGSITQSDTIWATIQRIADIP